MLVFNHLYYGIGCKFRFISYSLAGNVKTYFEAGPFKGQHSGGGGGAYPIKMCGAHMLQIPVLVFYQLYQRVQISVYFLPVLLPLWK